MKKTLFIVLFFVVVTSMFGMTLTLTGTDSYGDGWGGGLLDVLVNGTEVVSDFTVEADTNSDTFEAVGGDIISTTFEGGTWLTEISYEITDPDGNVLISAGAEAAEYVIPIEGLFVNYVAPENGALDVDLTDVELSWTMGPNASSVKVYFSNQMSDVASMEASAMVVDDQNVTSYTVTDDLEVLTTYYWRVVAIDGSDSYPCEIQSFITNPGEGIVSVECGDFENGLYDNNIPMNFYYKSSVSETIYLASELNIGGSINGMTYFNNFATDLSAGTPIKIWLTETTQADLATPILVDDQCTLVYDSNLEIPMGQNNIGITFDSPYSYGGGNLVVICQRPMDENYYSSSDKWLVTPVETGTNKCLVYRSDTTEMDPTTDVSGLAEINGYPNVRFYVETEGMGAVEGTLTSNGSALEGANIAINDTNYQTVSDENGMFSFPYVPEGTGYVMTATKHGYVDATSASFNVTEDETITVDFTIDPELMVDVTGNIVPNDPNLTIAEQMATLVGYDETYDATWTGNDFSFENVYAGHDYQLTINADGFQTYTATVTVADVDLVIPEITINERANMPSSPAAATNADNVVITWDVPADGGEPQTESFEDEDLGGYTVQSTDSDTWIREQTHSFSSGDIVPTDGEWQMFCMWSYNDQDEWLISPEMACPAGSLVYDWYGSFGSTHGDHYYVKISTDDGTTWTELWDASALPEADNNYDTPISIDINEYAGQQVKFAWQNVATGGLWHATAIDNVRIGGERVDFANFTSKSKTSNNYLANRDKKCRPMTREAYDACHQVSAVNNSNRALVSYNVYRFAVADEDNTDNWDLLGNTTELTYTDTAWNTLSDGFYKWGITAVYTGDAESNAAKTEYIAKISENTVTFNVTSNVDDSAIADAEITLTGQTADPDGNIHTYTLTTGADGSASQAVAADIYDYNVVAGGNLPADGTVDLTSGNQTENVSLEEFTSPASNVVATINGDNVDVTWDEPGVGGLGEWIFKCQDIETTDNGIGTGGAADMICAIGYTQDELSSYSGNYVNKVSFMPNTLDGTFSIIVYNDENELVSQDVDVSTLTAQAWNEVTFDNPVQIPSTGTVYIGYRVLATSGYPAGVDAGPMVDGGAMCKFNGGEWQTLTSLGATLNFNWTIKGYVSPSSVATSTSTVIAKNNNCFRTSGNDYDNALFEAEHAVTTTTPARHNEMINTRALTGFNVYRLVQGQEENQDDWTLLTTTALASDVYSYTDTDWDTLDSGVYKYAVIATYTSGNAPAVLSNIVEKDMNGHIEITVKDEENNPISGVSLTLGTLSGTTDNDGYHMFANVHAGEYVLTATKDGYVSNTQNVTVEATETATIGVTLYTFSILFEDSFEDYADFSIDGWGEWTLIDVDGTATWGIQDVSFEHAEEPMSYIIWNPNSTTPPSADYYPVISGDKSAVALASHGSANDDWMISKEFISADNCSVVFKAKSITDQYGLEEFEVAVSTGGTNPSDFTVISDGIVNPPTDPQEYTYSLADYADQNIRVGIHCVSNDHFMLYIDDFIITGGTPDQNNDVEPIITSLGKNYPNPFNPTTRIAFGMEKAGKVSIDVYNIRGQKVKTLINENMDAGNHTVVWNGDDNSGAKVASGVYFYRMNKGSYTSTKKMVLMK